MQKNRKKNSFPVLYYFGSTRASTELGKVPPIGIDIRIPTVPIFPVFPIRFGHKSGNTVFSFRSFVASYITFEDGDGESKDLGPLGPHMIHCWICIDPRISETWKQKPFSGSIRFYDHFSSSACQGLIYRDAPRNFS